MSAQLGVWFGRRAPEGVSVLASWGARAIYTSRPWIDIPHDRWSAERAQERGTEDNLKALIEWVEHEGLPSIKRVILATFNPSSTGTDIVEYDDERFHIEASPQGSGGYIYIGAWLIAPPPPPTEGKSRYYITLDGGETWTGRADEFTVPPARGTRVVINFNGFGAGTVEGYFVEDEWAGVIVRPDVMPEWRIKQNKGAWHDGVALVFGAEIHPEKEAPQAKEGI